MNGQRESSTRRAARGLSVRELNERARKTRRRDTAGKLQNKLAQPQNRWQRLVRYVWDKKR